MKQEGAKRITIKTIEALVHKMGKTINAKTIDLPKFRYSGDFAFPYVEVNDKGLHYVIAERGEEIRRDTTNNLDDLLYIIFKHVAFNIAARYELANRIPDSDPRRQTFAMRKEILEKLNFNWGKKIQIELNKILSEYPFDDFAKKRGGLCNEYRKNGLSNAEAWAKACEKYPLPKPSI